MPAAPRDPRQEAQDRLDASMEARVLEPSPPAVAVAPFVDDPTARGDAQPGRRVVSPVTTGDVLWDELVAQEPELGPWCAERWLGAYRRLERPPAAFAATREALHLLAANVISPTRARDRGEIALRWVRGGFGTPFFGADAQLRVDGDRLVLQSRSGVQEAPITSVWDAAAFVGFELGGPGEDAHADEALVVDRDAALALGEVFGFATSVLEQLRAEAGPELEPSFVNLWPEHFDVAVEIGSEAEGRRAAFGISPGDAEHAEPYAYVAPWRPQPPDDAVWNATAFPGAELPWSTVLAAEDQRRCVLAFLSERLTALRDL